MSGSQEHRFLVRIEARWGDLGTRYAASPRQQDWQRADPVPGRVDAAVAVRVRCDSGEISDDRRWVISSLPPRLIWAFMVVGLLVTEEAAAAATATL